MLTDRGAIALACEESGIDANRLPSVVKFAQGSIERLRADREAASGLGELAERVELSRDGIRVSLKLPLLPTGDHNGVNPSHLALTRFVPIQLKRRGIEMRLVLEGDSRPSRIDLRCSKRSLAHVDGLTICSRAVYGRLTRSQGGKASIGDPCGG